MSEKEKERMLDLLTDQVLFGLTREQETELNHLRERYPEIEGDDSLALTASAINLTNLKTDEPMPHHLRSKILASADEIFSAKETPDNVIDFHPKLREVSSPSIAKPREDQAFVPRNSAWQWLGWGIAAAACIALVINLWFTRTQIQSPTVLTAAQQREQLLNTTPDLIKAEWTEPNPDSKQEIAGDVVWSNSRQQGFMRLRNFPRNDANRETYQLWIIDANQDAKTPVDGGVFDVSETGEVIIPINAKLKVEKPQMFAVTAEKPGGVVVSKRDKMLAVAKVSV
jgi:anti-sigma-K factor RskA